MHLSKFIAGVILCILAFISLYSQKHDYNDLLLVSPKQSSGAGISIENLEEISSILTYGISGTGTVRTAYSTHLVNLIETNDTYPFIVNYATISGSFFNKDAFEKQKNVVSINNKAAFEIFGSIDIVGNSIEINKTNYIVTGVIEDDDEEKLNVYTPIRDKSPDTFLVRTSNKDISQNEFKQIGITETNYNFVDLSLMSHALYEKTLATFAVFVALIITIAVNKPFFTITAFFSLMSWLFTQYTSTFLSWKINAPMLRSINPGCFSNEINFLQSMELYSNIFLTAFFIFTAIIIFQNFIRRSLN